MEIYEVLGIGFGPSNLSLAALMQEESRFIGKNSLFLEQKESFAWHENMLLPGTTLQVSFLKDLVTQRNPNSQYSFISYLHDMGRLSCFINMKALYPTRLEFHDYLNWVAVKLSHLVRYSSRVIGTNVVSYNGQNLIEVEFESNGVTKKVLAKNIVCASGGTPNVPFQILSDRNDLTLCHSSIYKRFIKAVDFASGTPRVAVIGKGQSAAEIALHLYDNIPGAQVDMIFRGFSFKPADSSEFVNQIFDHETVDQVFDMKYEDRTKLIKNLQETNYSVIDEREISRLFNIKYEAQITNEDRLTLENFSKVESIEKFGDKTRITIRNEITGELSIQDYDAVICATGYKYPSLPDFLNGVCEHNRRLTDDANIEISREYRLGLSPLIDSKVYTQGCNEGTHGLGDTLLSNLAIRAGEVLTDILNNNEGINNINVA